MKCHEISASKSCFLTKQSKHYKYEKFCKVVSVATLIDLFSLWWILIRSFSCVVFVRGSGSLSLFDMHLVVMVLHRLLKIRCKIAIFLDARIMTIIMMCLNVLCQFKVVFKYFPAILFSAYPRLIRVSIKTMFSEFNSEKAKKR